MNLDYKLTQLCFTEFKIYKFIEDQLRFENDQCEIDKPSPFLKKW